MRHAPVIQAAAPARILTPDAPLTFLVAAERVLDVAGAPLTVQEIAARAFAERLVSTRGAPPGGHHGGATRRFGPAGRQIESVQASSSWPSTAGMCSRR